MLNFLIPITVSFSFSNKNLIESSIGLRKEKEISRR